MKIKEKQTPLWFYIVLGLIPVLLLIILEISLSAFDYGKNYDQWINAENNRLMLNPDIAQKYFNNTDKIPHSNNDSFERDKQKNTFRIFVLGGSTTAGFPYSPNGTFPRYLRNILEYKFPMKNFEVINLGITAINTYTILDLLPNVISESPDLVIVYAGHNEFYGALGVGSTQSLSSSPFLVNTYLSLKNYKTFQLLENTIRWATGLTSSSKTENNNSLMSRMAEEQTIEFGSDLYIDGINQFEYNLDKILSMLEDNNIPTLIGTLASNVKNQEPFISTKFESESAKSLFINGIRTIEGKEYLIADSLLTRAKDLDGLRFRAPSEFNNIIINSSKKYNVPLVDIHKILKENSFYFIIGNELMIDHLHPNLEGYYILGKSFYNAIIENNILGSSKGSLKMTILQDKFVKENFPYSTLDSLIADYRINNLLDDWPFKNNPVKTIPIKPKQEIQKLAFSVVYENLNWRIAHQKSYQWYLNRKDYKNFAKEIEVLLSQYPYKYDYYNYAAETLLKAKEIRLALKFINKKYKLEPDLFTTKWLGNISLLNKDYNRAIKFYSESLSYNNSDHQIYYNIGLAYYNINNLDEANSAFNSCLKLKPKYVPATNMINEITKLLSANK